MTSWFFWYFDILSFAIYLICLKFAYLQNNDYFHEILLLPVFGFLLEYSTILAFDIYSYNKEWPLMILGVPVSVAFSWANIVFAARLLSDTTKLTYIKNSMMQALIAVSLDFAMDPNSVRIGPMWSWDIPSNTQYFGIPWANYFGWLVAVFSFSFSYRYFSQSNISWQKKYYIPLTLLFSIIGTGLTNGLYVMFLPITSSSDFGNIVVIVIIIILFLISIYIEKPKINKKANSIPSLVFGSFLISYLILAIIYGVFSEIPKFIPIFIIIFFVQMYLLFHLSAKRLRSHRNI